MPDATRANLLSRIAADRQRRVAEMELRVPGHVLRPQLGPRLLDPGEQHARRHQLTISSATITSSRFASSGLRTLVT